METPLRELNNDEKELVIMLRQRFFLFPRDYWKSIAGGVLAFFLATGVISWGAAKAALEWTVSKQAADEIVALRDKARLHVNGLEIDSYIRTGSTVVLESQKHPKWRLHNDSDKKLTLEKKGPSSEYVQWSILKASK